MKNDPPATGQPHEEAQQSGPQDTPETEPVEGRSGEGAHSAMKHWLHEERHRLKRSEH